MSTLAVSGDVDRFAEYLAGLKARSGRTYAALALRSGVSKSAVHRYCTGASVPADFGTAERIGRSCRASRLELVELHDRWRRADVVVRGVAAGVPEGGVESHVDSLAPPVPRRATAATT